MKIRICLLIALFAPVLAPAQKREEKPRVHAEFYFGSLPASRELADIMSKEPARIIISGFHSNWSVEKIAKELKRDEDDLRKVAEDLEEQRLAGQRTEYEVRPFMPVIRDRDIERLRPALQRDVRDFAALMESHLPEIQAFVASLPGANAETMDRKLYETVVSGILLGGMVDAFHDDKTMIPPGPRRLARGFPAYGWVVESDPALAGVLKREARESDNYQIVSIGLEFSDTRVTLDELRNSGAMVLDGPDARRFRTFVALFSRDKLLPFFKAKRADLLKTAAIPESAKYVAAAEFLAWYYNAMANGVVDRLVTAGKIKPPASLYTYAIQNPLL